MSSPVMLTPTECATAAFVAVMRNWASQTQGHADRMPDIEKSYADLVTVNLLGVCGEVAVAKLLRVYWQPTVNTFHHEADVGHNLEVRTSPKSDARLIVRQDDSPDRYYVLVTGSPPLMTVRGYLLGAEARRADWLNDPGGRGRPSWFVPQSELCQFSAAKHV